MQTVEPTFVSLPERDDKPITRWGRWRAELLEGRGWVSLVPVLLMCALLMAGSSFVFMLPKTDVEKYHCYAMAFWQGGSHYPADPSCEFIATYAAPVPFHTLPKEYPILSLLPFSLTLLAPSGWEQVAFGLWMMVVAAGLYWYLGRVGPRGASLAFATYLVIGGWGTAASRFDLIPAAFTLFCLVAAVRGRFLWAYALLGIATMLKLYPLPLLLPLFLADMRANPASGWRLRRLAGIGVFASICAALFLVSLFISLDDALSPLLYFTGRPMQIESLPASIMWVFSLLGVPICSDFQYSSLNVYDRVYGVCTSLAGQAPGPMTQILSPLFLGLMLAGVAWVAWQQWRGRFTLQQAFVGILLVVILTGKVFSPQYFIWLAPLVAYVMGPDLTWLVLWCVISALTTAIYPFLYGAKQVINEAPSGAAFYPTIAWRNLFLTLVSLGYLFDIGRLRSRATARALASIASSVRSRKPSLAEQSR